MVIDQHIHMLLQNAVIRLRAMEPEDLGLLYRWENDTALWRYSRAVSPYSKLALRQYINDSLEMDIFQSKQLRLMIDCVDSAETIGTIDLYDIDVRNKHAGVGILIDKCFRQKNYAYLALELMSEYTFSFLKLNQLYAYIGVENEPSLRLFEKSGYLVAGTLRDWVISSNDSFEDVCIMQLVNSKKDE